MSKRSTISFGKKFHLFEETLDTEGIYLEVEDASECSFELWEMPNNKKRFRAVVRIPKEDWLKMIKDWEDQPNEEKTDKKTSTFD
jgi:hypothetical protein